MAHFQLYDPCFEEKFEHIAMFHYFISTAVIILLDIYNYASPKELM